MPRYGRYRYSPSYNSPSSDSTYPAYPATPRGRQHIHFASPIEFSKWLSNNGVGTDPNLKYWSGNNYDPEGVSQRKTREGVELLIKGDDTYVPDALALLSQVQEQIEAPSVRWGHEVMGAFPDVPRFLAGDPEHMWHREATTSDRTPLRVFVGTSCSWTISEEQLRNRGVVLAAFAIAMADIRPVIITPYGNGHDYSNQHSGIISYDLSTGPLVLSQVLPCLADPRVSRYVWITSIFNVQSRISAGMPFNDIKRSDLPNIAPGDLYLPPITNYDPLLTDPLGWLRTNIAHYSNPDYDYDISPEAIIK